MTREQIASIHPKVRMEILEHLRLGNPGYGWAYVEKLITGKDGNRLAAGPGHPR